VAGGDFYPFGLAMDDRQIKVEPYRFGYQGQYAEKDSLANWNAFQLRMYEPRFGRWLSPDPKGQFSSPYVGMGNSPVGGVDPDGGLCCGESMIDLYATAMQESEYALYDAIKLSGSRLLGEVAIVATKISTTSLDHAVAYWANVGQASYPATTDQARNAIYGKNKKGEKVPIAFWFNFTDKFAECVECVMAPMQGSDLFNKMSEQQGSYGRNAQVKHMLNGLKNEGYTLRKTDPKRGDLAFWTDDGTPNGVGTHVAYVYKVHGPNFATWGASVSKGTPAILGLTKAGDPFFTLGTINDFRIGVGKLAGFVTLKP